jgi:hypothetical protein
MTTITVVFACSTVPTCLLLLFCQLLRFFLVLGGLLVEFLRLVSIINNKNDDKKYE